MTIYTEDIIWVNQQTCTYHFHEKSVTNRKHALPRVKYIRADLHTDILKQVRDQVEFCKKHDHFFSLDKTMALIDKALGE